jgi:Zn-dependent protease
MGARGTRVICGVNKQCSGGIAVNVLLIGASLALLAVTDNWAVISESYREPIGLLSLTTVIIASMIPINAAFIISNALPLPGMDGSHLLNSGQSRDESRLREPDILAGTTLAGLAITAYTGSVLPTIAGVIITLSLMLYYRNATVNSLIGAT